MERVYTPEEIAELLKVNVITICRHLRDGSLKGFKVGRIWRVTESNLNKFMESGG